MNPIVLAVLVVGGVALAAGLILAIASVLLAVPVDEKAVKIREALPGANCGGCGYSGCDAYAAALATGEAKAGLCAPGGEATAKAIAEVLGGEVVLEAKTAVVRCGGCEATAVSTATYQNVHTCAEAARLAGGAKGCAFGCLGFGDCAAACSFAAISVENGLARIDRTVCHGCGVCAATCPKSLIDLIPADRQTAIVVCRSPEKGAAVRKVCKSGCIGCGKCTKTCPNGAVTLQGTLAVIDPSQCTGCGACAEACPAHCIVCK